MEIETMLEKPYWVIDVLPKQVPAGGGGRFFAIEQHLLAHPQLEALRARFASVLLKLNCYYDIEVSTDAGETWAANPEPPELFPLLEGYLHAAIPSEDALIVADGCDTHMTLYNPSDDLLDLIKQIAASEGLFVWQPPQA